ncbi:Transcriptional regulator of nonfermentable carbon utilization [Ceratocystis pirilliformis]|uniref:Transcriptional regulator of nonfermentable carbon utilization n=1 Tax=Ceratocystis pirilliformis TaxID=259994 RepID=A0ABR3ZAZ8_9PEZI
MSSDHQAGTEQHSDTLLKIDTESRVSTSRQRLLQPATAVPAFASAVPLPASSTPVPIKPLPVNNKSATMASSIKASSMIGTTGAPEEKKKYDPKDPLRPRRKKARRACFACQRAHLTCGDERPCQRCIKRGLGDACQDGVRKKAKYLHDAPPESLRPVLGPNYTAAAPTTTAPAATGALARQTNNGSGIVAKLVNTSPVSSTDLFAPSTTSSFPVYSAGSQTSIANLSDSLHEFNSRTSPVSPTFHNPAVSGAARNSSISGLNGLTDSNSTDALNFNALFDPSNPAFYSFEIDNLDRLDFGSQYPALEFGMLGYMSKSAEDGSEQQQSAASGLSGSTPTSSARLPYNPFDNVNAQFPVFENSLLGLSALDPATAAFTQGNLQHGLPHAYAISAGSNSLASPSTENTASPQNAALGGFDGSPTTTPGPSSGYQPSALAAAVTPAQITLNGTATLPRQKPKLLKTTQLLGKRRRNPSTIYESVKEPYPYINGFHRLIVFLRRRFPADKTLKIVKSLSSIRPSFMSCTKSLNREDLVFMEKCLQRTLFEYEDFMQHTSAPTIVCRRTGEVAAVNKEFTALTGWTKDVLLGKALNENVNTGIANRSASTTPVQHNVLPDGKPQPVFIPELLDDESVVQFYEDYAHLAFGDSRGHVNRTCRLLKYRKSEDTTLAQSATAPTAPTSTTTTTTTGAAPTSARSLLSNRVIKIDSEHGISKIEKDGKVDCTYCWMIKRDMFDIPMLIVINFLPCYYRNQQPLPV